MSEKDITVPEADRALRSKKEEELDQFQRRALEYTGKFSKVDAESAEKLVERITQETGISRKEAIMIVNIMPKRAEELAALFSSSSKRLVSKADAEKVIKVIRESSKP
ncbi:MAG: hypothetical protein JTT11_02500 [Candidatus Brockarchaeota archaeon]|nr:hypothetical protein [Candidatus Brockarchaeota archaeon]